MAITEDTFAAATRRATARVNQSPGVTRAFFDPQQARVVVELNTGMVLTFPVQDIEGLNGKGLSQATPQELQEIEISPSGLGIHVPALDVDLYIPSLLQGRNGHQAMDGGANGENRWKGHLSGKGRSSTRQRQAGRSPQEAQARRLRSLMSARTP